MICIAYSDSDPVSKNAAEFIKKGYDFEDRDGRVIQDKVELLRIEGSLITADYVDKMGFSTVLFMSRHHSSAGITSFTSHSLGNWTKEASLGGMPKKLSTSSPVLMLACMRNLSERAPEGTNKVYEATHHGPLLDTPCTFIEFGGSEAMVSNHESAEILGQASISAAQSMADNSQDYSHAVIGIGGNHYPSKFTRLALEKGYAFGHIMPSHSFIKDGSTWNTDMIEAAIKRSDQETELAVIDWKSLGSEPRSAIINKLEELGIDYERA
jgi:D-aminoacyl-tRNA deacylase